MTYGTIYQSNLWTPSYTAMTSTDMPSYSVASTYEELNYKDLNLWHTDISAKTGFCYDTLYPYDPVDNIYVTKVKTYGVELKGIKASAGERRYRISQLYENIKKENMWELWANNDLTPLYVRYFNDDAFLCNLSTIDFSSYAVISNPEGSFDNRAIFKDMEELGSMGILVRCPNWWATANTVKDRNYKQQKDVWFLPNEYGRWRSDMIKE